MSSIFPTIEHRFCSYSVVPTHTPSKDLSTSELYHSLIARTVEKGVPAGLLPYGDESPSSFDEGLPYFSWTTLEGSSPCDISFFLVCHFRLNAFKFFYEMITHWLIPGKRSNAVHFFASDFHFPSGPAGEYSVGEVKVRVEDAEDLAALRKNLPLIASEIRHGVASEYHAQRILEVKGLSHDEKAAAIHEHIAALLTRRPKDFSPDIFTEMQHALVMCSDIFKASRSPRHISRIIVTTYLFRKALCLQMKKSPKKRHLYVKVVKTHVDSDGTLIPAIGIVVGMNIMSENEAFEERHLLKALQGYLPGIYSVPGSFFANSTKKESVRTVYLEIAKEDKGAFSLAEVRQLRRKLPNDLGNKVEHLMHPIFMPQNEEETMRNIVTLSSQLHYVRDIPQVIISFDKQSKAAFTFNVIMLRILKKDAAPVKKLFKQSDTFMKFVPDRVKNVGVLRKRYPKEATVFRVALKKRDFLRSDHSLDIARARRVVAAEMTRILGEFRDYNGGIITKQDELLSSLKKSLPPSQQHNDLLLENFFYSLTPIMARAVVEPAPLNKLFSMFLDAIDDGAFKKPVFAMKTQDDSEALFVMITTNTPSLKEKISHALAPLQDSSIHVISSSISSSGISYLGYIYLSDDKGKRKHFLEMIAKV